MPSTASIAAGSAIALILVTMPAAALDLDVGGLASVSAGRTDKGGLGIGLGVNLGGVRADSKTSLGGGSLVDSDISASVGGDDGINASNRTTVGGRNGLLDSSTKVSAGGTSGINASVDADLGGSAPANTSTGTNTGGSMTTTSGSSRAAASTAATSRSGRFGSAPGNPGSARNPGTVRNFGFAMRPRHPSCLGAGGGPCRDSGNSNIRKLIAGMTNAQFMRNQHRCRGILADPNKYERGLIDLCRLLMSSTR